MSLDLRTGAKIPKKLEDFIALVQNLLQHPIF